MATTTKEKKAPKSKSNGKKHTEKRGVNDLNDVQDFLSNYGYLNLDPENTALDLPPDIGSNGTSIYKATQVTKKGELDEPTENALKSYQEFHGLKCTGKFDDDTKAMMNQKRCGCPDSAEFSLDGRSWPSNNLTYGFDNFTPDLPVPAIQCRQAVRQAFALWAAETPLSFRERPIATNPDIRIEFGAGAHGDGFPFDGPGGVLAHAFYPPPNGGSLAGDAHFDEDEDWTINIPTGGDIDLVTVAAHEFGHSLGLRHSAVAGALMQPFYAGPRRQLHNDDIAGIRAIYGAYITEHSSWIHGTSMQVEYPTRLQSIRRAGFYTSVVGQANTTNWFHFAIPNPAIEDRIRLRIAAALLRFRTLSSRAIVQHVHIYDGFSRIASHNNVNLSGNQWNRKYGVAHKPNVRYGLGISLGVRFLPGTINQRRMDFVSAGADFIR